MKALFKIGLFYLLMLSLCTATAQDVSFSQFYSNPLYLNPAFSGSVDAPRVALQYRNQWQKFDNAYTTYSAAFDMPVKKLQGGFGFFVMNDAQANHILNSFQLNLIYSVFVRLNKTYWLNGGFQTGFNQNSLKTDRLVFPDNVDPYFGNHGISGELQYLTDPNYSYLDFSTGVLIYSEKLFFGIAAHHLAEPRQSFYSGQEDVGKLYRKYTVHFGAKLPVYLYGHQRKKFDISPQFVIHQQGDFSQINYGVLATKYGLTLGTWFRQNFDFRYDAVIFLVGFLKNNWQLTYSYDFTVSGLWGDTGGTSEISLSFFLGQSESKRNFPFYNRYEEQFGSR